MRKNIHQQSRKILLVPNNYGVSVNKLTHTNEVEAKFATTKPCDNKLSQPKPFDNTRREPVVIDNEPEEIYDQKGNEIKPIGQLIVRQVMPIGKLISRQPKN